MQAGFDPGIFRSLGVDALTTWPPRRYYGETDQFLTSFLCCHVMVFRFLCFHAYDRLVDLVVRRPPQERKIPGSNPICSGIFPGWSHTSDSKIGTPVATLPGAWRYRVSAGTDRSGVNILWLGEVESLICNFYLSVAAHKIVWADPSLRYTRMLLEHKATNKHSTHTISRSYSPLQLIIWFFFFQSQIYYYR